MELVGYAESITDEKPDEAAFSAEAVVYVAHVHPEVSPSCQRWRLSLDEPEGSLVAHAGPIRPGVTCGEPGATGVDLGRIADESNHAGVVHHRPGWLAIRIPGSGGVGYLRIDDIGAAPASQPLRRSTSVPNGQVCLPDGTPTGRGDITAGTCHRMTSSPPTNLRTEPPAPPLGRHAPCVNKLIQEGRFPAPRGGSVDVSFPFMFTGT